MTDCPYCNATLNNSAVKCSKCGAKRNYYRSGLAKVILVFLYVVCAFMAFGFLAVGYFGLVGEVDFSEEELMPVILWLAQVALVIGVTFVVFKKTRKPLETWEAPTVAQPSAAIVESCPYCSNNVHRSQKRCVKCGAQRKYHVISRIGGWLVGIFGLLCIPAGVLLAIGGIGGLGDDSWDADYQMFLLALIAPFIISFILYQIFKTPNGEWKKK